MDDERNEMIKMENNKYEDIIALEHPTSKNHPRMSEEARAAQFAPFAALTGFEDKVNETARRHLEEYEKENKNIDNKTNMV